MDNRSLEDLEEGFFGRRVRANVLGHPELWAVGDTVWGRDKTEKTNKWQCREAKERQTKSRKDCFLTQAARQSERCVPQTHGW